MNVCLNSCGGCWTWSEHRCWRGHFLEIRILLLLRVSNELDQLSHMLWILNTLLQKYLTNCHLILLNLIKLWNLIRILNFFDISIAYHVFRGTSIYLGLLFLCLIGVLMLDGKRIFFQVFMSSTALLFSFICPWIYIQS
jgi:hypothetical protein